MSDSTWIIRWTWICKCTQHTKQAQQLHVVCCKYIIQQRNISHDLDTRYFSDYDHLHILLMTSNDRKFWILIQLHHRWQAKTCFTRRKDMKHVSPQRSLWKYANSVPMRNTERKTTAVNCRGSFTKNSITSQMLVRVTSAGFLSIQTSWPLWKAIFSGSCAHFSYITVHRCTHGRASLKWMRKELRIRAHPHICIDRGTHICTSDAVSHLMPTCVMQQQILLWISIPCTLNSTSTTNG